MTAPSNEPVPPGGGLADLVDYAYGLLEAIRQRWWLVTLMTLGASAGAFLHAARQPKIYAATTTILLDTRPIILDKVTDVVKREDPDLDRFYNLQARLLESRDLAEATAKKLGLPTATLVGRLKVDIDRNAPILRLMIEDPDPLRAQSYVNAFADIYIADTINDRLKVTTESARLLADQARALRGKLEGDERTLYDFQRSHELPGSNFDESHKIQSSNLQALHAQYANARAAGIKLKADLDQIDAAKTDPVLLRALVLHDENPRIGQTREDRQSRAEQLAQLESRYGPQHPKVIEARVALAAQDQELDKQVATSVAALRARARANASEQAQLHAAIESETKKAVELRESELEYKRHVRQIDEDRAAYDLVSRRQKEAELQGVDRQTYARRLEAAQPPTVPVRPNVSQWALAGALFGFLASVLLARMLDLLNDVIRLPFDAERALDQPVLGLTTAIPSQAEPGSDAQAIETARAEYVVRFPRSRIAEQFHGVATNLFSLFLDREPRAIMVVSAAMDEGKTLMSVTLAATLAARGKKVLLVDADLRRGRLHRLFTVPKGGGLFELVMGRVTPEEAIRATSIPNVDLITTGAVPDKVSPVRVLELEGCGAAIAQLKERYDLVVFDTPPVGVVSDAQLIGGLVDGAVGVVRSGRTSRRLARTAASLLSLARVNLVGWIVNDVSEALLRSGYYYKKYGHEYARYGYYYNAAEDEPPAV